MGQNQSPATSRRSSRTSPARRSATLKMRPRSSRSPVPSQRRGHTLLLGAEDEQEHNGDHDQGQKQREGNTKARNSSSSNYNNKSNSNSSSSQNDAGSGSRIGNNRVKSSSSSSSSGSSSSSNDNIIAISNTNDNETDRGDYKKNRAPKTGNVGGADGDNDDDDDDDDDDDFENTSSEEDEKTIRQTRLTRSARKTRASASMGKSAPTTPLTRRQKQQLQKSDETTNTNVDNNEESSEDDDEDEDEDGREVMHNSTPGRMGKRAKTSKLIDPPIRNGRVSTRSVTNTPNTSQTKQIGRTKSTRQSIIHNDKGFKTLIDEDEKDDQRKASLRGRSGKQQAKIVQLRTRSTSRRDSRNDITVLDPEASSQYSSSESSGDNVSNNDVQVVRQNRRRSERRVHREGKEASAPLRTTRSSARKMQTRKDKVSKRTKVKSASSVAASQSLSSSASEEEVENSTKLTKKSVSRKTPIRRTRGNSKVSSSKSSTSKRKRRRREVDIINEESNLLQQRTNDKSESNGSSSDSDSDNSSGSDSGEEGISQDRKRGKTKIEARTTRASARKHGQPFVTETESAHLGFPVKLEIDASTPEDFTNGTVFFYGDSITWGMAHNYTGRYMKTWPRLLSERLQQYKLDVVESALCSRTTAFDDDGNEEWMNGARPHDFNGLDHFVPEFVSACPKWLVVLLGTNDLRTCIRRRAKGRTRLDARHIAQSCARIPMKAREIQENNPFFSRGLKIIVICPPRVNLNALARELGYDESSAHIAQDFSKAYKEMCAEHGLLYAEANIDMSHSVDGIHVTEDANVLVADAVWSIFRQELGPPPEGVEAALSSAPLVTAPPNPLMEEDLKGKKRRRISTTGKQRSGESTEKDDEVKSVPSIRINSKQQNGRNNQKNKSSTTSKKGANITLDSESERDDGALDDDSSSAESGEEEDADEDHLTLSDLARLRQRNSDANEAKIDTSSSSNADSDEEENSSTPSKSEKPKRPLGSREHPTHMKRARKESSDQNSEDSDEENESGSDEEVDIEEEESSADENDDEDGDDESVEKEGRKYTKNRIEENDEDQDEEEDEDEDEEEDEDEDEEEDEGEEEDEDEEEEEDEDEVEEEDDEEEEISIHELQRRLHEEHVQQQQQLQMQQELQKRQLRHQQLQQEAYLRQLQHEQQLACQATSSSSSSMFNSANRPRLSSASSSYPDDPSMEDLETSFQSNESFYIVGVSRQDTARRISEEVALVDVFSRITGQLSTEDMEDIIDCILDIQNNPFHETKPRLSDILEKVSECAGSQLAYELAEIIGFST